MILTHKNTPFWLITPNLKKDLGFFILYKIYTIFYSLIFHFIFRFLKKKSKNKIVQDNTKNVHVLDIKCLK